MNIWINRFLFPSSNFQEKQKEAADKTLEDVCGDMGDIHKCQLRTKKILKGHLSKVTAIHYSGDSRCQNSIFINGR